MKALPTITDVTPALGTMRLICSTNYHDRRTRNKAGQQGLPFIRKSTVSKSSPRGCFIQAKEVWGLPLARSTTPKTWSIQGFLEVA